MKAHIEQRLTSFNCHLITMVLLMSLKVLWPSSTLIAQNPLRLVIQEISNQQHTATFGELRTYTFDFPVAQYKYDTIGQALFVQEGKSTWTGPKPARSIYYFQSETGELIWKNDDLLCKHNLKEILSGVPYTICHGRAIAYDQMSGEAMWILEHDLISVHPDGNFLIALDYITNQNIYLYHAQTGKILWQELNFLKKFRRFERSAFYFEDIQFYGDSAIILAGLGFTYADFLKGNIWYTPTRWEHVAYTAHQNSTDSSKGVISGYSDTYWGGHVPWAETEMPSEIRVIDGAIYKATESYIVKFDITGDTIWFTPTPASFSNPFYMEKWNDDILIMEFTPNQVYPIIGAWESNYLFVTKLNPESGDLVSVNNINIEEERFVDFNLEANLLTALTERSVYHVDVTDVSLIKKNRIVPSGPYSNLGLSRVISQESYLKQGSKFVKLNEAYPNHLVINSSGINDLVLDSNLEVVEYLRDEDIFEIKGAYGDFELIANEKLALFISTSSKEILNKVFTVQAYIKGSIIYDSPDEKVLEIFIINKDD